MSSDEKTPEEERFWAEFHRALDAAGRPSIAKISRAAAEKFDLSLPEATLREWINKGRLPRAGGPLLLMMRVINAEKQCDWADLRDRAQIARDRPAAREVTNTTRDSSDELTVVPEPAMTNTEEHPPQDRPQEAERGEHGGASSRRLTWWWAAAGVVLVGIAVTISVVLARSNDSGAAASPETTAASEDDQGTNVPCQPPVDAGGGSSAPTTAPPTAYAKGGAGRVELNPQNRELVVFDSLADGCAIIVTAKADGAETGTWANTLGKTGRINNGGPTPPKHIPNAWPEGARTVEFRACFGEVINGEKVFDESNCGDWAVAPLYANR